MKSKLFAVLVASAVILPLSACGSDTTTTTPETSPTTTMAPTTTMSPTTTMTPTTKP